MSKRRVVVTGLGILSPLGLDLASNWDAITHGRSGIGPITHFDVSAYPARIAGVVGIAGPYDFVPLKGHMADVFGAGDPSATQPVRLARADAPPMLLVTGSADAIVDPRETASLDAALRAAGAQVESRSYPGVGHNEIMAAMSRPFRDRASVLDDVTAFMAQVAHAP